MRGSDPSIGVANSFDRGTVGRMGIEGEAVRIRWTRSELVAVREGIELSPSFDGRKEIRNEIGSTLRANRREVTLDIVHAERLASHLVPIDVASSIAKVKLLRAVRDARRVTQTEAPARATEAA